MRRPQSQAAFKEKLGVTSEQLSDFEPKGAASEAFGVKHPGGFSQRALVLIDSQGVVRWSHEADSPGELPSPELLREGLAEAFGVSPAGVRPDPPTGRSSLSSLRSGNRKRESDRRPTGGTGRQ